MILEGLAIGVASGLLVRGVERLKIPKRKEKGSGYVSMPQVRGVSHLQTY